MRDRLGFLQAAQAAAAAAVVVAAGIATWRLVL
jgi:hypothetical protein